MILYVGRAKQVFDEYDKDHSGALDAKEFTALTFSLGGNFTQEEIANAMKQLDTGTIVLRVGVPDY